MAATDVQSPISKHQKVHHKTSTIQAWTNIPTEEYLESFGCQIPPVSVRNRPEHKIDTLAVRFSKKYQESISLTQDNMLVMHASVDNCTINKESPDGTNMDQTSGRTAICTVLKQLSEEYKIDNTSMGFSWWTNSKREDSLTQKEYNKSCTLMIKRFNGEIVLTPLAGPNLAYAFVVPSFTQIGMMTAFKTLPNQLLIRERMKELSSMKTCYYTQLHWKKGAGHTSHMNESA